MNFRADRLYLGKLDEGSCSFMFLWGSFFKQLLFLQKNLLVWNVDINVLNKCQTIYPVPISELIRNYENMTRWGSFCGGSANRKAATHRERNKLGIETGRLPCLVCDLNPRLPFQGRKSHFIQNHWRCGLRPSSGKHNVSETAYVSVFRCSDTNTNTV
jgi:hypothetical protein